MIARLATAAVGIPLLVLVVWVGDPWFTIAVATFAAIGATEICRLFRNRGVSTSIPAAVLLAAVSMAIGYMIAYETVASASSVLAVGGSATLAVLLLNTRGNIKLPVWAASLGAGLYPALLLAHAPLLRAVDQGLEWVFFLFIVTFSTDTAAFFVGRAIGRRPLAPTISPKKTWEGAIGGSVAAIVAATVAATALDIDADIVVVAVLGALMGVAGQAGDLFESKLKRLANVKDSGWLIPGHGGVLDRIDSIVFNLVLVYYFAIWAVQ